MEQSVSHTWGHPDRYYSAAPGPAATGTPPPLVPGTRWEHLLESSEPDLKVRVERACRQWNNIVRDYMRTETGLRLSAGDDVQSVPYRVVNGMPLRMADSLHRFGELGWALLNRPLLIAARDGTAFMESFQGTAHECWKEGAGPASVADLGCVRTTAENWLKLLDAQQPVTTILKVNEDVLGAYFFRKSEIQIYWLPIGIVAGMLGVSPESLAVVVLIHELAHAYTHLGRDIDDERWNTDSFAATDLDIVEGLAQYYTQAICMKLEFRMPAALAAYNALLPCQSPPYQAHLKWVEGTERGGEVVRVSMIECRSKKILRAADFADAVKRHRLGVKGRAASTPLAAGRQGSMESP
jgi:hypothetical protein